MKINISIKKTIIEVLKLIIMIFIIANIVSYIKKPKLENQHIPDLNLTLVNQSKLSLVSYSEGKPLILYFWGSWCPICKMESPVIDKLSKEYTVLTIAVNSGSDEDIKPYMKKRDLHFPVVNDKNGNLSTKFKVNTFPTLFTYNKKGLHTFTEVGYTTSISLKLKIWISQFF